MDALNEYRITACLFTTLCYTFVLRTTYHASDEIHSLVSPTPYSLRFLEPYLARRIRVTRSVWTLQWMIRFSTLMIRKTLCQSLLCVNTRRATQCFCHAQSSQSTQKAAARPKPAPKKAAAATKATLPKMSQTTLKPKKPSASKKRPKPDSEDEDSDLEPSVHGDSPLSATPPSAKKQKKAPAPKKKAAKPLQEVQNEAVSFDGAEDSKPQKGSKSTETYQKVKSPCLRPQRIGFVYR